jgi:hypothetical protein
VKLLSWSSPAWMTIEGAVPVAAGIVANSIALTALASSAAPHDRC